MDYQTALRILNLKPGFTEEELKRAWRNLSKNNHPDRHPDSKESTKKQQQINAAREFLKPYAKAVQTTSYNPSFDIHTYITNKINILKNILQMNNKETNDEAFLTAYEEISQTIYGFETEVIVFFTLTKYDVDSSYKEAITAIKKTFIKFKETFYKKHYIDEHEVTEKINYECSLYELYEQFLKIEQKYGKKSKAVKQLEAEVATYKNYEGYERLETLIDVCKNNALYYIETNNFKNIDEELKKMHTQIKIEVFGAYYKLKTKLSTIEQIVIKIEDEDIKSMYQVINRKFHHGANLYDIDILLDKLANMIDEYFVTKKKEETYQQNEPIINKIYNNLVDRYSQVIKNHNIKTGYNVIKNLSELFSQILGLFKKGCDTYQNLEYFELFDKITFIDTTQDRDVISEIAYLSVMPEENQDKRDSITKTQKK